MAETNTRWGFKIDKLYPPEQWAFGFGISHWGDETYLYINLIFCTISIGKMYLEVE